MPNRSLANNEQLIIDQFNKWAGSYDEGLWSIYFRMAYKHVFKLVKPYLTDHSIILDIGCGTGGLVPILGEHIGNGKIVGIDISPEMLKFAEAKNSGYNAEFVLGSASELPFCENQFDVVFCMNSFHHYQDQPKVLAEIKRVLKPDGVFILLDPITDNPVRRVWSKILNQLFEESYAVYHSRKVLTNMLHNTNLSPVKNNTFLYFTCAFLAKKPS